VQRCRPGQEVERLEDETDLLVADRGELVVVEVGDLGLVQPVGAERGRVETPEEVHEGRLPRARRSHDGDELVAQHVKVDIVQGSHFELAADVGLAEPLAFDDRGLAGGCRR